MSAETLYKLCEGLGVSADFVLMGKKAPGDVSEIVHMLATLDDAYLPLAEDLLKTFFKAIALQKQI